MDDNLPVGRASTSNDDSGLNIIPPVSQQGQVPSNRPVPTPVDNAAQNAVSSGVLKEMESLQIAQTEAFLEEAEKSKELPKEVSEAGVSEVKTEIQIPTPVSQMGVSQSGPTAPVSGQVSVKLPITDDRVMSGLSANIFDSFRWIAEWSIRRLKMAHFALKKVGGKVLRVQTK